MPSLARDLNQVENTRPELAAAIVEMLSIYPRAVDGICGIRNSLTLRLGATASEVAGALRALEASGLIEQIRDGGLIPMWRLP
jgi:hypothetical protein